VAGLFGTFRELRRGLFSSPSRSYPFWLFLGIALLITYYFFKEVPDRQSQILRSDFGYLASESDQIKSVLQTYVEMLNAEVKDESNRHWPALPADFFRSLNSEAQTDNTDLFVPCNDANPVTSQTAETVVRIKSDIPLATALVEYHDGEPAHHRCIDAPLEGQVERIINQHVDQFDSVAVALSSGEVLYQRAQDGFRLSNIGNLLEAAFRPRDINTPLTNTLRMVGGAAQGQQPQLQQSQPPNQADWRQVGYTTLVEAEFETDRYKLLIQPIPLPIRLRGSGPGSPDTQATILLIGALAQDRLTSQARRLPLTELAPLVVLLLLALLALWPVLKVWKMAPTDGFKIAELLFLACSLLGAVALITLVTLYALIQRDSSSVDVQLDNLTNAVDSNLAAEITKASAVLDAASESPLVKDDIANAERNAVKYKTRHSILSEGDLSQNVINTYPWLDQLAWADMEGTQIVKWSAGEHTTRRIPFSAFDFFPRLTAGELWTLTPSNDTALMKHSRFLLAPIHSPLTGKYLPIILHSHDDKEGNVRFAAISSYLISVIGATLPPNFGFAIIDERGNAQFHSDAARNLGDNLANRIYPAARLQHVILARDADKFYTQYLDGPVRMHAAPLRNIQGSSWTLVTWYSLQDRNRFLATVFGQSMSLILAYILYVTLICVGFYIATAVFRGRRNNDGEPFLQYFPTMGNLSNLLLLAICYVATGTIYMFIIRSGRVMLLYASIPTIPILVAIVTWVVMGTTLRAAPRWIKRARAPLLVFVIATSFGALLLGAFPALSFTELRWDTVRISYFDEAKIRLVRALADRDHSVRENIRAVKGGAWMLQERLGEKLDRYDLEFPRAATVSEKQTALGVSPVAWWNWPPFPFGWYRVLGALIAGTIVICFTVWRTLVYRFQWEHRMPPDLGAVTEMVPGCNKIILTLPWQDAVEQLRSNIDARICSVAEGTLEGWKAGGGEFVIVTGLEEALRTPEASAGALRVIENLLKVRQKTVILVSSVDPALQLMERTPGDADITNSHPDRELLRWLSILNAFEKERLYKSPDPQLTIHQCHLLWKSCSAREKLVLWHLVKYRLPNPKNNSALDTLIQRGLVARRDTRFYLANKVFAEFVRSDLPGREVEALFPPDADSAWRGLRWVLIYTLIVAFAVILFSFLDWWEVPVVRALTVGGAAFPLFKTAWDIGIGRKRGTSA
jgi:hypothetical protein